MTCLPGAESVSRLRVVEKWRGGDVDELHVWHREHHLRALHVRKTEPRGAGERRFPMRARDAPQRGPGHLRELLRGEHGEATKAQDADADRVRCHEVPYWSSGSVHRTGTLFSRYRCRVVEEGWHDPIRLIVPVSGSDMARIPPHLALSRSRHTVAGW